jgi:hypothetical protein
LRLRLLASTVLRVAPAELRSRARGRFGGELRRAGSFAQLSLLGAQACLDAAGAGRALGLLWTSAHGALLATRAALVEQLQECEPVMPFTFVATQPHLAAALLAQRSHTVARSAFLYLGPDGWPWLMHVARAWLADCDQVLVGWVEESTTEDVAHQSDWCLLASGAGGVQCEPSQDDAPALQATTSDWLSRLAAWQCAPRGPLTLRGAAQAWRFSAFEAS